MRKNEEIKKLKIDLKDKIQVVQDNIVVSASTRSKEDSSFISQYNKNIKNTWQNIIMNNKIHT